MSTHLPASDLTNDHQKVLAAPAQTKFLLCPDDVFAECFLQNKQECWGFGSRDKAESAGATCCQRETAGLGCQRGAGPAKAGSTWQSHQDVNLSRRHGVNSWSAKPPASFSQTSCTYQRFSGNCRKPRRPRESIPHEKPGPQE